MLKYLWSPRKIHKWKTRQERSFGSHVLPNYAHLGTFCLKQIFLKRNICCCHYDCVTSSPGTAWTSLPRRPAADVGYDGPVS